MKEVRLIDANALLKSLKSGCENCSDANTNWCEHCCKINDFEDLIDNAPTVNIIQHKDWYLVNVAGAKELLDRERPKGEWKVNNYGEHICPICGHYALYDECQDNDYYEVQSNFCPECGADLRGEKK